MSSAVCGWGSPATGDKRCQPVHRHRHPGEAQRLESFRRDHEPDGGLATQAGDAEKAGIEEQGFAVPADAGDGDGAPVRLTDKVRHAGERRKARPLQADGGELGRAFGPVADKLDRPIAGNGGDNLGRGAGNARQGGERETGRHGHTNHLTHGQAPCRATTSARVSRGWETVNRRRGPDRHSRTGIGRCAVGQNRRRPRRSDRHALGRARVTALETATPWIVPSVGIRVSLPLSRQPRSAISG